MVPTGMPGAQVYYHGGYPPTYPTGYVAQPTQQPSQQGGTAKLDCMYV